MSVEQLKPIRLGVTGLSRAGKTVFVTSFIHNLICSVKNPHRMPQLSVVREGRLVSVDVDSPLSEWVPRFPYENNINRMLSLPPEWPIQTKDISEIPIRLTFTKAVRTPIWNKESVRTCELPITIVDYPGEWLLDMPLKDKSFAEWSRECLTKAMGIKRAGLAAEWLNYLSNLPPMDPTTEQTVIAHNLYVQYLKECREERYQNREERYGLKYLQPGRFICPGDASDAPIMWFCPLPDSKQTIPAGVDTLWGLMEARYEGYKKRFVKQFVDGHFSAIDRQIVLVDALGALSSGKEAFEDTRDALRDIGNLFKYGSQSFWSSIRVEKTLIAATKTDHVSEIQIDHLRGLLNSIAIGVIDKAKSRAETMAIASIVCTQEKMIDGMLRVVGRRTKDGKLEGYNIPPITSIEPTDNYWSKYAFEFPRFEPQMKPEYRDAGIHHINLDKALEYLIGDKLA